MRYESTVIRSFADRDTEALWLGERPQRIDPRVHRAARLKLAVLSSAADLEDLRVTTTTREDPMSAEVYPPVTPGEVLLEEFLNPKGISQYRLARAIGVPPRRINEIVLGKRRITADTALRLGRYFGMSEQFWINLQSHCDLEIARDTLGSALDAIDPLRSA
jgi:addiction module HigA family antidote